MADENKPAFYPRVGRNIAKNFRSAQPKPFIDDERAMELPRLGEDSKKFDVVDLSIPTKENIELGRRMTERDVQLKRQADADMSPLEKLAGGIQAGRLFGSALAQSVASIPTALREGSKAADEYVAKNIYQPTQPKALEYAQDVGDFLERLETEYKLPPVATGDMLGFTPLLQAGSAQAARQVPKAAKAVGMGGLEMVDRGMFGEGPLRNFVPQHKFIIKPVGGNWIPGEVENALKHLKRGAHDVNPMDAEELGIQLSPLDAALNNWVDTNLTNYLKKQMGTEKDPVRLLADEGITHYSSEGAMRNALNTSYQQFVENRKLRGKLGMPEQPKATTDLGRTWEEGIDNLLDQGNMVSPKQLKGGNLWRDNPWLQKLPLDSTLYRLDRPSVDDMNLPHIMDVLREDLASGRISPEDLKNISMDRAVRRTHEYNLEMAEKLKDAKAKKLEGMPVYKEYPEEGYKWVQLEKPGDFASESDAMGHSVRGYEPPKGHPDWVEGSGDRGTQRYGLGGWEAIKRGDAKVYSLVDKKGEPHVTIEVGSDYDAPAWYQKNKKLFESDTRIPSKNGQWDNVKLLHSWYNDNAQSASDYVHGISKYLDEAGIPYKPAERTVPKIHQIKGKGNARPVEKYDPFTQDFVFSDNWDDVMDLENTGLKRLDDAFPNYEDAKFFSNANPNKKYVTQAEIDAHNLQVNQDLINEYAKHRLMPDPESKATFGRTEPMTIRELAELEFPGDIQKQANMIRGALQGQGGILPPLEGMKRGGVVVSKNLDTMMLEVNNQKMKNGEPAYAGGKLIVGKGLKAARPAISDAERALPLRLTRAMPKSNAEINAHAERVARQMMGEHVTSGKAGDTKNLAGRSMKESQRVKALEYELEPTKVVPESQVYQPRIGDINVALGGDFTVSDVMLKKLMGEEVNSKQEGGSRYGLGHMKAKTPLFYASNEVPAQAVQNKVTDLYDLFGPERVMGHHMAMGPIATNFAQHFADANLRYTDYSKLTPENMMMFDQLMAKGYEITKKNPKTGEVTTKVVDFPKWPGIANPQAAYEAMRKNSEMRKFYNKVMQTPSITEPLGLPNGLDVRYAITSPDLRDMEVNLTGHGVGELVPYGELTDTARHKTYSKGIPGMYAGHQEVLTPFAISFPDAAQHIISTQRPQDFTGTIQKVFPHQRVDQQFIDEMEQYRRRIKELTGKKKGGAVKKAEGGYLKKLAAYINGDEFVNAAKKYGIKDSMNNLNKIVDLVNKGLSVDDAARQVADSGMHKAAGGAITGDDLIIEERPL
jgi:hypothetical protein